MIFIGKIEEPTKYDYLIMLLLFSVSGFLFLLNNQIYLLFVLFSFYLLFLKQKKIIDKKYYIIIILLIALFSLQFFKFDFFPFITMIGILVKISIAYFAVKILNIKFTRTYSKVLYFITLISFIFYLITNLSHTFTTFLINNFSLYSVEHGWNEIKYSIGLYTIYENPIRNPGPFWEPGAFAGYLIIGIIFNLLRNKTIKDKETLILILGLLTTFSTTGYLAFFIVILMYLNLKKINPYKKYFISSFIIIISSLIFINTPFLFEKIEYQLDYASKQQLHLSSNSQRFLNILRDIKDFEGHEFIGRGPHKQTRFDNYITTTRTNGMTDIIVEYGIFFFILLVYLIYISSKSLFSYFNNKNGYVIFIIIIVVLLQSEIYFDYPLFWTLPFLSLIYNSNLKTKTDQFT